MEYKDYYQTLGLDKSAGADDIKKAYRKLVRKYHPDLSKEADADRKTKELNEAYGVLGDPEKRAAYDQLGQQYHAGQSFQPPPDWGDAFAGNDLFADLFAHLGGRRRPNIRLRGEDSHASIEVELADAYHGATRAMIARDCIATLTLFASSPTSTGKTAGIHPERR
ncbi:MAG: DnaJ domain-containing protein [Burkholderiaceae bacterium]|nr:DnaJ domain-containing protein [Burkholderiaceae bacterium]